MHLKFFVSVVLTTAFIFLANFALTEAVDANDHLSEIATNFISKYKKASIREVFPGEWLDHTLGAIFVSAKAGVKSAQTARKLLTDTRFDKR